ITVVVNTAKCICSPYSAYIGVGNVVPTMMAANAYANRPKANRRAVLVSGTLKNSHLGWVRIPPKLYSSRWSLALSLLEYRFAGFELVADRFLGADAGERTHLEL